MLRSVTPESIIERACSRTGLTDFGSRSHIEGLEVFLDSALKSPATLPIAVEGEYERCVAALENRLRVVDYAKSNPKVMQAVIERPLFVLGMPRSGTTLVSYLLDQDPDRRSLLLWESRDSVPPPTTGSLRTDPRCSRLLARQKEELTHNPTRLHMEWADGPTECLSVHGQDFKGLIWEARIPVPDYSRWLLDADLTSAYDYQKLVLQTLQSCAPGTWSLKMPSHALFLDYLLAVFPDARLVWTHRDPYRAVGSVLDMKAHNWGTRSGNPAVSTLLDYYPEQLGQHVQRPMRTRKRIGNHRFHDVFYSELMRDPIAEIRRLYTWAGDVLTAETEAAMLRWLKQNPQGRFGTHRYGLEQFGLTKAQLDPYFSEYLQCYDIEPETDDVV